MSLGDLKKMIAILTVLNWSDYDKCLFKAMLLISFHAFLRPGEMTASKNAITLKQVSLSSSRCKIRFINYKHSKGLPVTLKVKWQHSPLCPVKALKTFLVVWGIGEDNLFPSFHTFGTGVVFHMWLSLCN